MWFTLNHPYPPVLYVVVGCLTCTQIYYACALITNLMDKCIWFIINFIAVHFTLCCFLTHMRNKTLSATVLTLWVAPPKNDMIVFFFIVDQSRSSGCVYQM